jgi:four helix bundle protein
MHNFKELIVWQKGRELVMVVYALLAKLPSSEQYGLTSQMKRAVCSIPSNIAEGAGRGSDKDFLRFLDIANGSAFELETQLYLCIDLAFIKEDDANEIFALIREIQRMIFSLKSKYQVA